MAEINAPQLQSAPARVARGGALPDTQSPALTAVERLAPEVHVIRCDLTDPSDVAAALRGLGCVVTLFDEPSAWLVTVGSKAPPPDVVVIVGRAEQVLSGEWVRRARAQTDAESILVAATSATVEHAAELMKQGAGGLLLLPNSAEGLVSSLRDVVAAAGGSALERRRRADLRRCMDTITSGEAQVLQSLLRGAANKQIASDLGVGLRTVELRRAKVMRKMNAQTISQLVLHVAEAGVERVPKLLNGRKRAPRS